LKGWKWGNTSIPVFISFIAAKVDGQRGLLEQMVLEIKELVVKVGGKQKVLILNGINLSVPSGSITAILGPSGCGKSTLLRTICGFNQPTSGEVFVNGIRPTLARQKRWIGLMPQRPVLLPNRTVQGNLRLVLELNGIKDVSRVDELLDLVQLRQFSKFYPPHLSGGMAQRVALARSLITYPKLLLMDEPFSALDESLRERLQTDFLQIQRRLDQTVLLVTHSIEEAVYLGDTVVVFSSLPGQIKAIVRVNIPRERIPSVRVSREYFESVRAVRENLQL